MTHRSPKRVALLTYVGLAVAIVLVGILWDRHLHLTVVGIVIWLILIAAWMGRVPGARFLLLLGSAFTVIAPFLLRPEGIGLHLSAYVIAALACAQIAVLAGPWAKPE